jgi:glycosyltransferase involved in cell wall biosynthesis
MTHGRNNARAKLLFCSVNLNPPGGGQCVGAWALQALRQDWDITILCAERPDCDALNRHFGTRLQAGDFRYVQLPWLLRNVHRVDPDPHSYQRAAWLMRKSRKLGGDFDVTMAVDNEMDFGRPGIQYVHYPYLAMHRERVDALRSLSPSARLREFLGLRYRPWMLISGISFDRITRNLTLVNSHWSANVVRGLYDMPIEVLYPPVHWSAAPVAWEQRQNTFVSLGRIEPGKRQTEAIDIIERVRQHGHDVGLEIIGDVSDPGYAKVLRDRAKAAGPWVQMHHGISRGELEQRVGNCRFGLHTMRDEHFGIAVAELVRAGCIVFVPGDGGQVEIIGKEPALMFETVDQAVERISAVLENTGLQARLGARLSEQMHAFNEEQFMQQLRDIVQAWVSENRKQREA